MWALLTPEKGRCECMYVSISVGISNLVDDIVLYCFQISEFPSIKYNKISTKRITTTETIPSVFNYIYHIFGNGYDDIDDDDTKKIFE